ncbi:MAG TPA: RIP metalloprotease RseP [Pyrinomonadaceae bacterium]
MFFYLSFIVILGAAVIIHEFGHFIVAKLLGIRVETFSVGFGKRLFGRKWGTTDYRVSLIPLGGYVKLGGDDSNAGIEEGSDDSANVPVKERFDLRPRWQKFLVAVAGPIMNILTAIAIPLAGAMAVGAPVMPPPVVKTVQQGAAGEAAGLRPGDRIVSFNGRDDSDWERISNDALLSPEQPIPLVVERDGERVPLTIRPVKKLSEGEAYGELGIVPDHGDVPVVIFSVEKDTPASEAGILPGDRVVSIGGEQVGSAAQIIQYINEHPRQPITMQIERDGQTREVTATARRLSDGRERLGIGPGEAAPIRKLGLTDALGYSVGQNIEILRLTGMALKQVFTGQRSMRDTFSGPVGIAVASKRAVEEGGVEGGLKMLGFLSLNLGVFNLLPIPVLDGGMIFMLLIEGILAIVGMKLSMGMRERIQQVGFVFLLLLMSFVIINDLAKVASRWRGAESPPAATEQK